jgi:hypothetical protein
MAAISESKDPAGDMISISRIPKVFAKVILSFLPDTIQN